MKERANSFHIPLVVQVSDRNEEGVRLNLLVAGSVGFEGDFKGDFKGVSVVGGLNAYDGAVKGVVLSGLVSVMETLSGVSYGTLLNYSKHEDGFALQIGLYNSVSEYHGGTVVQIGLMNRIGNQTSPIVNFRGLEKIFKKSSLPKISA